MTESAWTGDSLHKPVLLAETETETETETAEARFRAIYEREFAFVWAAARHFGVPPAARDDVVQDVFLTAYRRLDQVHYQVSARAWLYGVTRRIASHYHRGAARRARRHAALGEVVTPAGEAPHERLDAARLLERLLARLPRGAREVWELTELLGMSGPEIAAELDLPLNTVYSRLRLARAQLHALAVTPELVAAARRRDEAPPETASRAWAAMVPLFGRGELVTLVAAGTAARSGVATTLILAGVGALAVAAPSRGAPDRAPPGVAARDDLSRETSPPRRGEDMSQETASPDLADDLSLETSSRPPALAPLAAPAPRAAALTGSSSDELAAEVALLDRARAHLDAGEPAAAELVLAAHAREFPRGALVDAREAAAIEVLCLRGRRADAELAARRLVASRPDSVLARRFQRFVCPDAATSLSLTEPGLAGDESRRR